MNRVNSIQGYAFFGDLQIGIPFFSSESQMDKLNGWIQRVKMQSGRLVADESMINGYKWHLLSAV